MQHDLVELITALEYAKEHFGDDTSAKVSFKRDTLVDGYGQEYRLDVARFWGPVIQAETRGTKITITVIGLKDDVAMQRELIASAIAQHRDGKL